MDKPNCFECKYRKSLPGTAHSKCVHPSTKSLEDNPLLEMLAIFASVGRTPPMVADTGLNVKGHPHGIAKGWFNHPWNFDPTWLESCDGFEALTKTMEDD